jgi:glycosyltransferase involved in cell wall biosynthesis
MKPLSVIVTAQNNEGVLPGTLTSVEDALAFHAKRDKSFQPADAEVVVVDDGSTDHTADVLQQLTHNKPLYTVIRRERPSSPSCARNTGVAASSGELLLFLDGDDLFLPSHIDDCWRQMQDPHCSFVKTGVRLRDPIHPDWRVPLEQCLAINLCVRRRCHKFVGGFPDYHLCTRQGEQLVPTADLFFKVEDQFYNRLLFALFQGFKIEAETVEHRRYPGNSFDRQYAKFCRPLGQYRDDVSADDRFRASVADLIIRHRIEVLRQQLAGRPLGL